MIVMRTKQNKKLKRHECKKFLPADNANDLCRTTKDDANHVLRIIIFMNINSDSTHLFPF